MLSDCNLNKVYKLEREFVGDENMKTAGAGWEGNRTQERIHLPRVDDLSGSPLASGLGNHGLEQGLASSCPVNTEIVDSWLLTKVRW